MAHRLGRALRKGIQLSAGPYGIQLRVAKKERANRFDSSEFARPHRLHLGPGVGWTKPDGSWITLDADPRRADLVVDFNTFSRLPLAEGSVAAIYGSHVFEHMSIYVAPRMFEECRRVLAPGGVMRLVLPDAERSIREYVAGNYDFSLFVRRRARGRKRYDLEYTLFECMKEDFLSRSSQTHVLGVGALAHQNAWDFDSISADLKRAGFKAVVRSNFQKSSHAAFEFEGTYPSEANETDRSLYVEAW